MAVERNITNRDITYRSGYKYQLVKDYRIKISIKPSHPVHCEEFIALDTDGSLTVCEGYAWDGATALYDTRRNKRASLVHDALYQLLRKEKLPMEERDIMTGSVHLCTRWSVAICSSCILSCFEAIWATSS